VQGVWHPFLFKDTALNLTTFPNKDLSNNATEPTATDTVLELARKLRKDISISEKAASVSEKGDSVSEK
jgi:hypothetical protein